MKSLPIAIALISALSTQALAAGATECIESGVIYSRGSGDDSGYNATGLTVAAGWRSGNHKLQLQVSALAGENERVELIQPYTSTATSTSYLLNETNRYRLDHIPLWINYRYGLNFGPGDKGRVEFGPTIGVRVQRLYTHGHVTALNLGSGNTDVDADYRDSSGNLSFDYGVGGSLSYALTPKWRIIGGLAYIGTTGTEFEQEVKPLGTTTTYTVRRINIDAHATSYASLSLEYSF